MSPIETSRLTPTLPATALRGKDGNPKPVDATPHAGRAAGGSMHGGIAVEIASAVGGSEPPVDAGRVQQIREALRDGTYPIVPTEIADALIAARLMLGIGQ